jgi:hypothetical protein
MVSASGGLSDKWIAWGKRKKPLFSMKIKTEIDIEELVKLRQALFSLKTVLRVLNNLEPSQAKAFSNDAEIVSDCQKILDKMIQNS